VKVGQARRLARAIGRLAARISSSKHTEFAQGMLAELDHIEGNIEALTFSAGSFWASVRMRTLSITGLIVCGNFGISAGLATLACTAVFVSGGIQGSDQPMATVLALGFFYAAGSWLAWKRRALLLAGYALIAIGGAGLALWTLNAAPEPVLYSDFYRALALEAATIAGVILLAASVLRDLEKRLATRQGLAS